MKPTADNFRIGLRKLLEEAEKEGRKHIDIRSGDFHKALGGYPGPHHCMPTCCNVMREMMKEGDVVVKQPPKGRGANLIIRYQLPRQQHT